MMHQVLVEYLLNAVWQVPLVAVGAVIVSRVGGLAPGARNLVWLAFLVMAVGSPALPIGLPSPDREITARTAAPSIDTAAAAVPVLASANLERVSPLRLLRIGLDQKSGALIKLAFATAAAMGLARLTLSGLAARRLARDSTDFPLSTPLTGALEQFMRAHDRRTPPVRQCMTVASPVVVGALNPVILVPERFADLAEDDQRAALLHECAHVVRRDYAVNLASELMAVPLSWHPALYPIKAGVRRSREMACDAMAAAAMASEQIYARRLLSLAKSLGGAQPSGASLAVVGLFGKSSLEERLMHLMTRKGPEHLGLKTVRLGAAATVTALALTPVMLFRVAPADAQTATAPAAVPAMPAAPATPASPSVPAAPESNVRVRSHIDHRAHLATVRQEPSFRESVTEDHGQRVIRGVLIGPDSKTVSVIAGDASERIEGQQRRLQDTIQQARQRSEAARRLVDSPEFKQRIADLAARQNELAAVDREKIQQQVEAAHAAMKAAQVQAEAARAEARIASAAVRESLRQTEEIRREVERSLRDATRSDRTTPSSPI